MPKEKHTRKHTTIIDLKWRNSQETKIYFVNPQLLIPDLYLKEKLAKPQQIPIKESKQLLILGVSW